MLLLVHISPKNIRKVQLPDMPQSVDDLKSVLAEKLNLQQGFHLQYEDLDFGNALCNLCLFSRQLCYVTILKVLWDDDSVGNDTSNESSFSSPDMTFPTTSTSSPQSDSPIGRNHLQSVVQWPSPFTIPTFSHDVELRLRKGNEDYEKKKKPLSVSREIKSAILDRIAQVIFDFKAYTEPHEIDSVCSALVCKHPCLAEPGKGTGWDGWKMSIKFKVGNYRSKMRAAGCSELNVNQKRRDEDGEGLRHSVKKSKRAEVNFLPGHPEGQNDDTLEAERLAMVDEMKKKKRNNTLVKDKMNLTFSLRRKVVEVQPLVSDVQERWPVLFMEDEICLEFYRITNVDLLRTFKAALETFTPKLLRLYRARKGAAGQEMQDLLEKLDEQTTNVIAHRKRTALEGLPLFLRESPAKLFKTVLDTDTEECHTRGLKVGILTTLEDDVAASNSMPNITNIAIVLEEIVVLAGLPDLPSAFAYLFGLIYAMNIEYPMDLNYTFETIQKLFLELCIQCSARVQSLKTKLLQM
ncbi:hypothetical protein UPYG_G00137860 [Umbra pygmaea]|uniref:Uncharacterized protein n=1 Tax=Umbra pygmaea TaxID=75934 RepID=A0ABD0WZ04_UMBPY